MTVLTETLQSNSNVTTLFNSQDVMGKKLSTLLNKFPMEKVLGTLDREISSLAYDSRKVEEGGLFTAIPGIKVDGDKFIPDALARNAHAFISQASPEKFLGLKSGNDDVTAINVKDARHAMAWLAAEFYSHPSKSLNLVGITGTNGKTTLSYILESIYQQKGNKCGVIGTINCRYGGNVIPSNMTTPESIDINRMLDEMLRNDVTDCFLEVSSHSLDLKRVRELRFSIGVLTNLSRDHIDFHKDMDSYKFSKKSFFKDCFMEKQVVNVDDIVGKEILNETTRETMTTGIENQADVMAKNCRLSSDGIEFTLSTPNGDREVNSALVGKHNIYNLLSAAAVALLQGLTLDQIASGIQGIKNVPGRFETIQMGQDFTVAVDYAHTSDALENVLNAAKSLNPSKIITVFGCGGDRDRGKRAVMGDIATSMSDYTVITDDNPRSESSAQIIDDIKNGIPAAIVETGNFTIIPDRRKAIRKAIEIADKGNLVLIAGKGHEDYQILSTGKIHFDDREVAREALKERLESNE
ncbi:MAG: UDP-N-acetylmuramoyl-L-alanyl-D-glutamate--2,6-diaminopimelate ligase [Nitrospinales bacterium]